MCQPPVASYVAFKENRQIATENPPQVALGWRFKKVLRPEKEIGSS
jgi:hypothetical protein